MTLLTLTHIVPCHLYFNFKKMSAYERVKQWNTFTRVWHIFDAKWQNPIDSAKVISKRLQGLHKPIYHPLNDCGDHVIVFNSRHIALPGYEWKRRAYFHHTGYPGGASWTLAWQLHEINPTLIVQKAVKWEIPRSLVKFRLMARLHIFPDEDVPEELLKNVSSQIRQIRSVPRNLNSYSEQEINEYPKIMDFPKSYVLK